MAILGLLAHRKPGAGESMPEIELRLDVPQIAQTKRESCWHAAAEMIWLYWQRVTGRQGPMNTHEVAYAAADTAGIVPEQLVTLARRVGLLAVPTQSAAYSSADVVGLLKQYGPLWCAGFWFGTGHVIVLTGVSDNAVFFNDPDGGLAKTGSLDWFNERLAKSVPGCLMYKDPSAY